MFTGFVDSRRAEFKRRAIFQNRRFINGADFGDATFCIAPEFHNAVLHQDTDFSGTGFLDRTGDAARAYRTLKLAMESVRSRDEEARFYGYEQESLRARKYIYRSVKIFSWLYEKAANYGQSIVRPMAGLFGVFITFSLVYLAAMHDAPTIIWTDGQKILRFSFQQVFQPFGPFRASMDQSATPPVSLWLALVASLHSLLTFAFLALFLLALRRRFRL